MAHPLWSDPGTWIALGATAVSVAVGVAMSVVFRRILRRPPPAPPSPESSAHPADPERRETP
ncbi:hypothetical protein B2J86_09555 [Acidovorax sp. SRB_14]|uniref:hypothetical protein n=1 Tax=unclassified Acidovorax TaxID=2684926 RepID=UPI00145F7FC8|nr:MULTISPECIES: hypothetical protein [unclassified Acidovorax]NMM78642.1 hypothetical protein [Acidovorax sp. SRB_24]NMM78762.1 hypothetical protein [Acidovorax sp. SRB_24]NMM81165.1 hypothetical protein [Acidovorax sp. SRB_14]NMM86748.1 hypothetical protein [Rhodococcus sp. SRB_17]